MITEEDVDIKEHLFNSAQQHLKPITAARVELTAANRFEDAEVHIWTKDPPSSALTTWNELHDEKLARSRVSTSLETPGVDTFWGWESTYFLGRGIAVEISLLGYYYGYLDKFVIFYSTVGAPEPKARVYGLKHGKNKKSMSSWRKIGDDIWLDRWPGLVEMNTNILVGGQSEDSYDELVFVFLSDTMNFNAAGSGPHVARIWGYGNTYYATDMNNPLATTNKPYSHFMGTTRFVGAMELKGGRVNGSGCDEGLVIKPAENGCACVTLGDPNYQHTALIFNKSFTGYKSAYWGIRSGAGIEYPIYHPCKGGTIALTSDVSDRRLKNSIEDFSDEYEVFFNHLQPKTFKLNEDYETPDEIKMGFIAQEVQEAFDEAGLNSDEVALFCKPNNEGYFALRYQEFIALNTHMIQKANAKISILEEELLTLKKEIEKLKGESENGD